MNRRPPTHPTHPTHPSVPTRLAGAALALALAAALTACGGSDAATSGDSPAAVTTASNGDVFNEADVQFATEMTPHHAQAIEMVNMMRGRPLDPDVARLAEQIRDAQAPEVETMTGWLTAWGEPVPETSIDHANGDDSGSGSGDMGDMGDMTGMMSQDQMDQLAAASDADFQDLWLQMMVEHHTGAIEMATAEQADGAYDGAIALAGSIISSQQAEIATMKDLLG
ncbi:DUF305 domain-containing protein [soil metagenome]